MIEYRKGSTIAKKEVTMLSAMKNDENLNFMKGSFYVLKPIDFVGNFSLKKWPLDHESEGDHDHE